MSRPALGDDGHGVEVQEDGSLVAVGERDWQEALFDAASIKLLGQVADETSTWDVYEIVHRDSQVRTYALEVGAGAASLAGPGSVLGLPPGPDP